MTVKRRHASDLARAEAAIAKLVPVFIESAQASLDQMRQLWETGGLDAVGGLYPLAHDLKGQGRTFGFPAVTRVAERLCRNLQTRPAMKKIAADLAALERALKPKRRRARR